LSPLGTVVQYPKGDGHIVQPPFLHLALFVRQALTIRIAGYQGPVATEAEKR
jgi:hypothetical protein